MLKSLPRRALLWAALPAVLLAPNAFASTPGDAHKGEIAIESWSLGAAHGSGGGGGAGKVSYSDLSVMISLEKASPLLNLAVADGKHFDAVELTFRAPAGAQARGGTGKTMAAEVLANTLGHAGGANFALADGSVKFVR